MNNAVDDVVASTGPQLAAPEAVHRLVRQFAEQQAAFRQPNYNEQKLRIDFLNPMLEALGWDVANAGGQIENVRDVIYEDRVKVGGATRMPDYGLQLGGVRKFFVEAKRPSIDLRQDPTPALQLRRYAWSAKLPLSILTDFEEWVVYDCRIKPLRTDSSAVARLTYFRYDELPARWGELAGRFGRDAVQGGALERFAAETRRKRGTEEVDDAFLADLEGWRELLARNIALRNTGLSVPELNEAVQQTLDRIIFLRICEDRGIEAEDQLKGYQSGTNVYGRLTDLFRRADARYNSGLFHFKDERGRSGTVDDWTLNLSIDDKVLKDILKKLYFPESPYAFAVIPADILGQVYERFLGKVIRLTPAGRAVVEEKPEVRKAGGVYYTPTFVVDYIVKHTVGPLLEGKTPAEAAELRIVDPACGSGSFLLGAYQYLLDWHLAWYTSHEPKRHKQAVRETDTGDWRLTTSERKRILTDNIYGVDIDPQAVEVTKLSLVLKVLEGETDETLGGGQMRLQQERALPDLGRNVQCGNSLIGTDVYVNAHLPSPDDETSIARINAFDWHSTFDKVFERGGFDAVIGNPPYVRIQAMKEWAPFEVELYKRQYRAAGKGNYDLYVVFVERGLWLLNDHGRLGFILPHKFFNAQYGAPLRALLAEGRNLAEVVHFGDQQIFSGATTYTCLMFLDKAGVDDVTFTQASDLYEWRINDVALSHMITSRQVTGAEWNFRGGNSAGLLGRLRELRSSLGPVQFRISQGIRTSANEIYVLDYGALGSAATQTSNTNRLEDGICRPFLRGRDIKKYAIASSTRRVIVPYEVTNGQARLIGVDDLKSKFPNAYAYLVAHRDILEARENGRMRSREWYGYVYPKNIEIMMSPKILVPDIAPSASYALDVEGQFSFTSGYAITIDKGVTFSLHWLLGMLNSRLIDYVVRSNSTTLRGGYYRYFAQYIEQAPICPIDPASPTDLAHHDHLVTLVQRMLDLHKRLPELKSAQDRTVAQRQIEATDREIDRLVYALYELTEEEIGIVEGRRG